MNIPKHGEKANFFKNFGFAPETLGEINAMMMFVTQARIDAECLSNDLVEIEVWINRNFINLNNKADFWHRKDISKLFFNPAYKWNGMFETSIKFIETEPTTEDFFSYDEDKGKPTEFKFKIKLINSNLVLSNGNVYDFYKKDLIKIEPTNFVKFKKGDCIFNKSKFYTEFNVGYNNTNDCIISLPQAYERKPVFYLTIHNMRKIMNTDYYLFYTGEETCIIVHKDRFSDFQIFR